MSYIKLQKSNVKLDKLQDELNNALNNKIKYLNWEEPNILEIFSDHDITSQEEDTIEQVVNAHVSTTTKEAVTARIMKAMDFGRQIIAEYGAANVLAGYNVEQIQVIMDKTARIQMALNTGSLYVALTELNAIEIDGVLVTGEKLMEVRHKIQDYLGLPRT